MGWVALLALAGGLGWWYQQHEVAPRSSGPSRHEAGTGGAAEAASATAEGSLLVDARPWGRIEKVLDTGSGDTLPEPAGSLFTPRVVNLPAGSYEITVSHPDAGSRSCQVEVRGDTRPTCEVRFFESDPRAYFQELGW